MTLCLAAEFSLASWTAEQQRLKQPSHTRRGCAVPAAGSAVRGEPLGRTMRAKDLLEHHPHANAPHRRQWCRRLVNEKASLQHMHPGDALSTAQQGSPLLQACSSGFVRRAQVASSGGGRRVAKVAPARFRVSRILLAAAAGRRPRRSNDGTGEYEGGRERKIERRRKRQRGTCVCVCVCGCVSVWRR